MTAVLNPSVFLHDLLAVSALTDTFAETVIALFITQAMTLLKYLDFIVKFFVS